MAHGSGWELLTGRCFATTAPSPPAVIDAPRVHCYCPRFMPESAPLPASTPEPAPNRYQEEVWKRLDEQIADRRRAAIAGEDVSPAFGVPWRCAHAPSGCLACMLDGVPLPAPVSMDYGADREKPAHRHSDALAHPTGWVIRTRQASAKRGYWIVEATLGGETRYLYAGAPSEAEGVEAARSWIRSRAPDAPLLVGLDALPAPLPASSLLDEMSAVNWEGDPNEAAALMRIPEDTRDKVLFELKRREEMYVGSEESDDAVENIKALEDDFLCRLLALFDGLVRLEG